MALLSTRKQAYDLKLAARLSTWLQIVPPAARDLRLDWQLRHADGLLIEDTMVPRWGLRVFKGRGMIEFPLETRVLKEADSVMVRVTNKSGVLLRNCWLWRGPRIVPLGDLDDGEDRDGSLILTVDERARGVPQARWERDLSHEMFKGQEVPDLLKRAIVERVMQEGLQSEPSWMNQVVFLGWLDQPLMAVSVKPGAIASQRATFVRMRLPL